ncbi:DUF305 domain-containing protein [Salinibacterium sp. NSLL150]|uniref:DUF305 domain-containing protein n=1 Tax=unclassified Salinibacterium TaxID=2632331 RepID=UPI0018CD6E9D|nr:MULTISPECIES: DUF305 domain-containing protein [unclassified Salinibacterium]MBH0099210.1 DUF305 domain-containing protein [Salinibacterium sp. NSLL35]MBH0101964.1 DUF305 domain-containing protein [Salinibacterium sp. NSLL150]MBH0104724.1 DUF305 domain-containing protein [Salinibacterium sp. NSLL16]MBH0107484.1 DUF305 domain-containing protein [Salinibacterium sp. NSLL17]
MTVGDGSSPRHPWLRLSAMAIAALLLVGVGVLAGQKLLPAESSDPLTTSAEAGFARDMQTHHLQAVDMAMIILEKSENQAIRTLAYDIATAQGQQAGQMFAWLIMWNLPQASSEPAMTWMMDDGEHDSHVTSNSDSSTATTMPGLATYDQMEALRASTTDADAMFLELMIAHHAGGVDMAEGLLERSTNDVVTSLAEGMVAVQMSEINYMNELLAGLEG